MASIVEQSIEVDAPVEKVFAYVDDHTTTHEWMFGLQKIEPAGGPLRGLGATYDGRMKVGVALTSRIRCTGWEQDRLIEFTSIKGVQNTQRWTFTPLDDGRTRVEAWISYTLPGGPAGKAIAAAVKPAVGVAVRHTSEALVRNLEQA